MTAQVVVRRAKHQCSGGRHNWLVYDYRGPKVFIRQFTFSYFEAAVKEAHRLAREDIINPRACFGVSRVEYFSHQDVLNGAVLG